MSFLAVDSTKAQDQMDKLNNYIDQGHICRMGHFLIYP